MKKNTWIGIGIIILAVVVAGFLLFNNFKTGNVIENEKQLDHIKDTCECIERNNLKCSGDFQLDPKDGMCKKLGTITNPLLGCSKYDCQGEIYEI